MERMDTREKTFFEKAAKSNSNLEVRIEEDGKVNSESNSHDKHKFNEHGGNHINGYDDTSTNAVGVDSGGIVFSDVRPSARSVRSLHSISFTVPKLQRRDNTDDFDFDENEGKLI